MSTPTIVAVESAKVGAAVCAAAVVYPVNAPAPSFTYRDRRGQSRLVGLGDFGRLAPPYRRSIVQYLKESALSWAVVARRDGDHDIAAEWAVVRALERLTHDNPDALGRRADTVLEMTREFEPKLLPGMERRLWEHGRAPWTSAAAALLARAPRACILGPQ